MFYVIEHIFLFTHVVRFFKINHAIVISSVLTRVLYCTWTVNTVVWNTVRLHGMKIE